MGRPVRDTSQPERGVLARRCVFSLPLLHCPLTPYVRVSTAQFITSCPSSNPPLPVTPLPALTLSPSSPAPNSSVTLTFANPTNASPLYAAWLDGLQVVFTSVDMNGDGKSGATAVPDGLHGSAYVGVVSSDQAPLGDGQMVSGLAIVQFPFDSMASEAQGA